MIYTYLDADKLSYTPNTLRFVHNSTMTQVVCNALLKRRHVFVHR